MVLEGNRSASPDRTADDSEDTETLPPNDETTGRTRRGLGSRLERRSVLKLLGVSAIPLVGGVGAGSTSEGYGAGGYGGGAYGDGTDEEEPLENTILFDGLGTSGVTEYEFTVTGAVEKSNAGGASKNAEDTIDAGRVTGSVGGWRDAFAFSGELETLTVDGQAKVSVNGERVDPADYGGDQSHVVTIVGNGNYTEYELASSGTITVLEGENVTVGSDGRAKGTIEQGVHQLRLGGELTDFAFLEGGTQAYLDTQRIDPAEYDDDAVLPHVIVFDGTDASERSNYSFTVDGNVRPSEYDTAVIDETDTVDGRTVTGIVEAGTKDAYRFEGSIVDFRLAGNASVDIDHDAPL